jgi:hypothetical protein
VSFDGRRPLVQAGGSRPPAIIETEALIKYPWKYLVSASSST